MTIAELRQRKEARLQRAKAYIDAALNEDRQLTEAEQKDYDTLMAKVDLDNETIKRSDRLSDIRAEMEKTLNPFVPTSLGDGYDSKPRHGEVRILKPDESLAALYGRAGSEYSLGKIVRGISTGNWQGADLERRLMNEGTGSAGGYLVPTPLSAQIIDLARKQAVVGRAGARVIPMDSQTLKIARLAGDPTAEWHAENIAVTGSDMTFESVTLTARTLVALCKMSVEVFEDANNIDQVVSNSISQALALELDRVALVGSGTPPEPQGIYGASGVQTEAAGGALSSYVHFVNAFTKIKTANGQHGAVIINPREWGTLENMTDGYGRYLYGPPSWMALTSPEKNGLFVTTQVPVNLGGGENESLAFVGDFTQLMLGMRTQLVLEATRVGADADTSAFTNMQVWVRAYLRADIQLAQPSHFCVVTGITA